MKSSKTFLVILLIGVVSMFNYVALFTQSIRLDESQQIWASTKSIPGILQYIALDVHVPLYAILLHFWIQIFGTSILLARIPSVIFYLLTLPILYNVYKEASNKKIALLATLAFSLSPFILWYSSEARMYTLLTLAASINTLYFLRMVRSYGKTGKGGYFFSTIFGLYSHYFFLFSLFTQMCYVTGVYIYYFYKSQIKKDIFFKTAFLKQRHLLYIFWPLSLGSFLFLAPWVWYVIRLGVAANTQPLIAAPTAFNLFQAVANFVFGFQRQTIQSAIISFWPIVVISFFFIFTKPILLHTRSIGYFVLSAFLPILIAFIISFVKPIFLSRYLIFTIPFLFFLIIWGISNYASRVKNIAITFFLLSLFIAEVYQNYSSQTPLEENYAGVSSFLAVHATASDIITVSPPFTLYPIAYSYTGEAKISSIPLWDMYSSGAIPSFSVSNLSQEVDNFSREYNDLYVVLSYDQGYQEKVIHYLDMHYRRITTKNFSPGLQVRVYQLRYS